MFVHQAASGDESILNAECKSMEHYTAGEIIFVLETYLSFPKIEVKIRNPLFASVAVSLKVRPSVEEVQKMLNSIGQTITSVSKGVGQWKKLERPKKASERVNFAFLH